LQTCGHYQEFGVVRRVEVHYNTAAERLLMPVDHACKRSYIQ